MGSKVEEWNKELSEGQKVGQGEDNYWTVKKKINDNEKKKAFTK